MEWRQLVLTAAELPPASEGSSNSVTVALVTVGGTVAVAIIGLIATMVGKSRTTESPPPPPLPIDPRIGETVAVAAARLHDARSTLNIQDHRIDAVEDEYERLKWTVEQQGTVLAQVQTEVSRLRALLDGLR